MLQQAVGGGPGPLLSHLDAASGQSCLMIAASKGNMDIMHMVRPGWRLVGPGAGAVCLLVHAASKQPPARNPQPFIAAAPPPSSPHPPCQLLASGADPHLMSPRGRGTALHEAVAARQEAAVELLLNHGCGGGRVQTRERKRHEQPTPMRVVCMPPGPSTPNPESHASPSPCRADPFLESARGETAIDLAVVREDRQLGQQAASRALVKVISCSPCEGWLRLTPYIGCTPCRCPAT